MSLPPAPPAARALPGRVFLSRAAAWPASWRPHLLLPAWACLFTTAALDPTVAQPGEPVAAALAAARGSPPLWLAAAALGCVCSASHLVNLLTDRAGDALNRKNLFWPGRITHNQLRRQAVVAALAGIGLAAALAPRLLGPILASLILGLCYSLSPLNLARRWFGGLAAHILGFGLVVPWLAVLAAGRTDRSPAVVWSAVWPAALYLTPLVASAYLLTTVLDGPGDRATGKRTWAVRWGEKATIQAGMGLLALVAVSLAVSPAAAPAGPWPAVVCAGLALVGLAARRAGLILVIHLTVAVAAWPGLATWPLLLWPALIWWAFARLVLWLAARSIPAWT